MKRFYSLPGLLISILFLIFSYFLIAETAAESSLFKEEKMQVSEILNFNDRLMSFRDWVFSEQAWKEKKELVDQAIEKAENHYTNALIYGNYLLLLSMVFLMVMVALYARRRLFFGLTMGISVIGMALLAQGIMNPALEISAFKDDLTFKVYVKPKDIPYFDETVKYMEKIEKYSGLIELVPVYGSSWAQEAKSIMGEGHDFLVENADVEIGIDKVMQGRTYFYYQNKGIMDVISLLWNNNNKLVAGAIGTFSVIVPLIKLFSTLLILLLPITGAQRLRKFLTFISKWSMADVFVISAFLAYLSFSNMSPGVEMDAGILFGLYYFAGYVIVSIILGSCLSWSIKEKERLASQEAAVASDFDPIK